MRARPVKVQRCTRARELLHCTASASVDYCQSMTCDKIPLFRNTRADYRYHVLKCVHRKHRFFYSFFFPRLAIKTYSNVSISHGYEIARYNRFSVRCKTLCNIAIIISSVTVHSCIVIRYTLRNFSFYLPTY